MYVMYVCMVCTRAMYVCVLCMCVCMSVNFIRVYVAFRNVCMYCYVFMICTRFMRACMLCSSTHVRYLCYACAMCACTFCMYACMCVCTLCNLCMCGCYVFCVGYTRVLVCVYVM